MKKKLNIIKKPLDNILIIEYNVYNIKKEREPKGLRVSTMKKITGLKKAVGDYQRANAEGAYSPRYGCLMYDKADGKIWTDEFYSIGHNDWKEYHSDNVVNLGSMMEEREIEVSMANVREFITAEFGA